MHDLNILFLETNYEKSFGAPYNQHEFEQIIGKHAKCKYAGKGFPNYIAGETVDETVNRVMPYADWVIGGDMNYYLEHGKTGNYKTGTFISDLHGNNSRGIRNPVEWANLLNKAKYDGVFMRYPLVHGTGYRPEIFYEVLGDKAHWIPWSVNTDKFYRRDKVKYDVAFLGAVEDCYPLRKLIYDGIYFVARGHKILCRKSLLDMEWRGNISEHCIVGDDYAEALGSTKILLFDSSVYRYPILKFFEGAASGCLVMSDSPTMGKRLGFVPRITYTEIDIVNWEEGLKFFLDNPKEVEKIAGPGMKMTRKYHNHDVRSEQFLKILEENS